MSTREQNLVPFAAANHNHHVSVAGVVVKFQMVLMAHGHAGPLRQCRANRQALANGELSRGVKAP
jgi:hypothetical protein